MTEADTKIRDRLADQVLERITDEHLTPRPRWAFVFQNYVFWGLGAVAVLLGAVAFSAAIFDVENVDWQLAPVTHGSFFALFLSAAPFLWAVALLLFVGVGYLNIRRTKHGYRYSLSIIVIGAILTSGTLGTALYAAGIGHEIEEAFGTHVPFYHPVLVQKRSWWLSPARGLLAGKVVSIAADGASFVLSDFRGDQWEVVAIDLSEQDRAVLAHGGLVRVVGVPVSGATASSTAPMPFHACFVLPWDLDRGPQGQFPPPVPGVMVNGTTSAQTSQSATCEDIRPYQQLRAIDRSGF